MATEKVIKMECTACGSNDIKKTYREEDGEKINVAKCNSCGAEYDPKTPEYYHYFHELFTDNSGLLFQLGTKGTLRGMEFEIVGRLRYQDEEDTEPYPWDEWVLLSAEGWFGYLVEAEDGKAGYYLYQEHVPESLDLYSSDDVIEFNGKSISREDTGFVGRIADFDGELPWIPQIGEGMQLYDFAIGKNQYTVEQTESEISITKGDFYSYEEVVTAFNVSADKVAHLKEMGDAQKKGKTRALVYGAALALSFIFFVGVNFFDKGLPAPSQKIILEINKVQVEKNGNFYSGGILHGPVALKRKSQLYGFDLFVDQKIQHLNNDWVASKVYLIKADLLAKEFGKPITQENATLLNNYLGDIDTLEKVVENYSFQEDFWHESGRDSEGPWTESTTFSSELAVMDDPGDYYLYQQIFSKNPQKDNWIPIVTSETHSSWYYLLASLVLGVMLYLDGGLRNSSAKKDDDDEDDDE